MAMGQGQDQTEALLKLVSLGNEAAAARLLNLHRRRLKKMIALRIDEGLAARQDPSDVVHETILAASHKLADYAQKPDIPFYAWLRCLAWSRLVELHRQNLDDPQKADFRQGQLTPKCLSEMVKCFGPPSSAKSKPASGTGGSQREPSGSEAAKGDEPSPSRQKVRVCMELALSKLDPSARELLLLYYVEQLTVPEIACVLEIETGQVKLRHVKAIRKLRTLLDQEGKNLPGDLL
ncbi:MAG: sigma-70 family RNA polymerase sigma factor [Pirellulaceae bacterium]